MIWLILAVAVVIVAFAGVLFFGAPYLPTLSKQVDTALELLELKPGQTLLELGSGDGKVLVAAAKAGLNVVGIELNPFLVAISWLRTWRYRKQVKIIWGDFWRTPWPEADGTFAFLLDKFMPKLDERMQQAKPAKLVSFAFEIPSRKPTIKKDGLFLYLYK